MPSGAGLDAGSRFSMVGRKTADPSRCTLAGLARSARQLSAATPAITTMVANAAVDLNGCRHSVSFRSEEHTSELQSLRHLVCRLLLEKKKHTSELQSLRHLVCRLLLEKKKKRTKLQKYKKLIRQKYNKRKKRTQRERPTKNASTSVT